MISHDNCLWTAVTCVYSCLDVRSEKERDEFYLLRFVSYLPLSHIAAQVVDMYVPLCQRSEVWFARPDALKGSLVKTLQQCHPVYHMGVPRVWEKIKDTLYKTLSQATGVKKILIEWSQRKGHQMTDNAQYGAPQKSVSFLSVAQKLLFNKIKKQLGFEYMLTGISSAAPIAPSVVRYLADLDIRVYELLGQSEGSGPVSTNSKKYWKIGTAGKPCQGVTLKVLPETHEICYFGRNVFMGYKDDEENTKETCDSEGYVHTGDIGEIDKDGFLKVTGRIKDIIITAGGENVAPVLIEDKIKEIIPCISNCTLVGNGKKFLGLLLTLKSQSTTEGNPDDNLSKESQDVIDSIGSNAKLVSEAIKDPKLNEYIQSKIDEYNSQYAISQAQNIRKWTFIDHDFGLLTGELTPTLKMKRNKIEIMYQEIINKLYEE